MQDTLQPLVTVEVGRHPAKLVLKSDIPASLISSKDQISRDLYTGSKNLRDSWGEDGISVKDSGFNFVCPLNYTLPGVSVEPRLQTPKM